MKAIQIYLTSVIFFMSFTVFSGGKRVPVEELVKDKKYNQAINLYKEQIKTDSTNSSVYYNLGNCYFYQNKFGSAVWAYEKSLKYNPKDKEAALNIEICYQKLHKTEPWNSSISWIEKVLYSLGSNFWAYFSIGLSLVLGFIIYLFFTAKNTGWRKVQLLGGSVILVLNAVSTYIAYRTFDYYTTSQYAIVTSKSIPTFKDDVLGVKQDFQLLEGDRVKIVGEKNSYVLIEMSNKEICAVKTTDIERI